MSQENKKSKKKDVKKEKAIQAQNNVKEDVDTDTNKTVKSKFGPSISFPYQRVWSRCILIVGVLFIVWYNSRNGKEIQLAKQKDILVTRTQTVECSEEFKNELNQFPGCLPEKCGRMVTDKLVTSAESDVLLKLAINGMSLGGSDGGATILDLHSGALSKGSKFVNIYQLEGRDKIFNAVDFAMYKVVKTKIQHSIAHYFGVDVDKIHLTKPTFFSQMTNVPAKTIHDEYWHPHVDKETYKHFHYTSLLYLNDYDRDFKGGRFIFINDNNVNSTVEPRKGRVLMFTSGSENLHAVEKVQSGTRYALTVSFTCDSNAAITDPNYRNIMK
ncbi:PREDICTED: 2-oxoglutarate and iron-dependent oxygenase domain-containing protein 3-like [Polistes canadensis]|uniref:2-oxoglutarate and iron-dependent oxygenase domain-containing protein 3-like n=1 Tax=Polistes canadensis TaxID=91411 RepID=UPI000718DEB5|nr:PREDICTED: 2-oxoglutarate and iron-dependent oxygenase domain-containing protein 3-like [Polistes canadensis]